MVKGKSKKLPKFNSLDRLVEFFDTHDIGECWDEMPEAHFEVDIKKRTHFFPLVADLAENLDQIAKEKTPSSEVRVGENSEHKAAERT
jgi:hypothetical protein